MYSSLLLSRPMIPNSNTPTREKFTPTVSTILHNGEIVETLYNPEEQLTSFVVWNGNEARIEHDIRLNEKEILVPYSPNNNLIQNDVILFPSEPEEYGSEEDLVSEIQSYIHRYVDVSPVFEKIASYYVLFTWVYDGFNELPYLRLRGEPGSGKTRFLQTVGALCYKPMFASGASSISPLFRIMDAVKGTLIIDETDFRMSDEKAEMTKIFNNGNAKGFPVLRSEVSPITKEFNPRAYHVFGPKIIATRGLFEDRALESRLINEEMGQRRLREDIPINLGETYKDEALLLRNKLLMFRFRNLNNRDVQNEIVDRTIEPRLNQIFIPLLSLINDDKAKADIKELARSYNQQMVSERGMDVEARLLEVVRDLVSNPESTFTVKEITDSLNRKYGNEYDFRLTPKYVGRILRAKLFIKTQRSNQGYTIPPTEHPKLHRLYERYGLVNPSVAGSPTTPDSPATDENTATEEHSEQHERREEDIPPSPQPPLPPSPPNNLPLES